MALVNSGGWSQTEEEASNLKLESVQNALARIEADMSELDEPTDADSELSMTQRVLLGSAILSVLVFPSLGFTPHTVRWSSARCPSRVPRTQPAARRVTRPCTPTRNLPPGYAWFLLPVSRLRVFASLSRRLHERDRTTRVGSRDGGSVV
jgi:hypothetical protein